MAYIGRTRERYMYYGAKDETFELARELRRSMTAAEGLLWSSLRNKQVNGLIFRRQHPVDIYIVDFYCHEYKLVIEVDGEIHNDPENAEKDKGRTAEMERFGLKIIRFTNNEIFNDVDFVIKEIKKEIRNISLDFWRG